MSAPAVLAFIAAACAVVGFAELGPALASRAPRAIRLIGELVDSVLVIGREGRDPGARERRRLLAAGAACAFAGGWLLAGPAAGLVLALGAPWTVARVLRAARERYRKAVDRGAAQMALALADALRGGHSLRGAVAEAAGGLGGAPGQELRRVARELELGARTEDALEAMRSRVRSQGIDTIVAAALLQRSSGGDLSQLLRDCARALEDQDRLERDARAATAQARFTGLIVVMLPLGGGLLAELANPGFIASLASSLLTAWLAGLALTMQVAAAFLIRRLGRVRV